MASKATRLLGALSALLLGACVLSPGAAAQEGMARWRLQSFFASGLPHSGSIMKGIEARMNEISGGRFRVQFYEPGGLIPPGQCWDAVSQGSVEACYGTPAFYFGRSPALALFSAVPFGPDMPGYLAWFYDHGGKAIYDEIYGRANIVGLPCSVVVPEAAFFRVEVKSVEDLKGKRLRYLGLGGLVVEKLGASTMSLPPGEIFAAFERGVIDAGEFATPAMDVALGIHEVAKFYYFPGWHQPATIYDLIINRDAWNKLTAQHKAMLQSVCGDYMRRSLHEGAMRQPQAMAEMAKRGIQFKTWSPDDLNTLERTWMEVAADLSGKNADFKKAWDSLQAFQASYKPWHDVQYPKLFAR